MENNQIHNSEWKELLANIALNTLMKNNLLTQEDFDRLDIGFGYLFSTEAEQIEALFRVRCAAGEYFFAAQNGGLMMVNIDEAQFEQIAAHMKSTHPCLVDDAPQESGTQKSRREKNNEFIREQGIAAADGLVTRWKDTEVSMKDQETICKRAIACLFAIQIACEIASGNYEEGLAFFKPMIEKYNVADQLNSKERRIVDGTFAQQDAIDMDWAYEAYWALCWCLGLVEDIRDASSVCDCEKAVGFVANCGSAEEFARRTKLRDKKDILDMLDLYYRYNWAINNAKADSASSIGSLNPSVVIERRRGLEWVVSDAEDWYDIPMNA